MPGEQAAQARLLRMQRTHAGQPPPPPLQPTRSKQASKQASKQQQHWRRRTYKGSFSARSSLSTSA